MQHRSALARPPSSDSSNVSPELRSFRPRITRLTIPAISVTLAISELSLELRGLAAISTRFDSWRRRRRPRDRTPKPTSRWNARSGASPLHDHASPCHRLDAIAAVEERGVQAVYQAWWARMIASEAAEMTEAAIDRVLVEDFLQLRALVQQLGLTRYRSWLPQMLRCSALECRSLLRFPRFFRSPTTTTKYPFPISDRAARRQQRL